MEAIDHQKLGVDFANIFDMYLEACGHKTKLVSSLRQILDEHKGKTILDCSVGTGFAMLDLLKEGHTLICSDGSEQMLTQFRKNAIKKNVTAQPFNLNWGDLGSYFPSVIDLVICRGNSIAYASQWDSTEYSNDIDIIKGSLSGMYNCLKPGGTLYVDIPSDESLSNLAPIVIKHPKKEINSHEVCVKETIENLAKKRLRKWTVNMSIDGQGYNFTRYSKSFSEREFIEILESVGFTKIEKRQNLGDRSHYSILTATFG